MPARRYALRRVNPFRGLTLVLEAAEARAVSTDGVNWELQVLAERPAGWGSLNLGRTETLYYRYGVWSEGEGMARYPVHPALERQRLHRVAEDLLAQLTAIAAQPEHDPVVPNDPVEYWLVDAATAQPLALLAAVEGTEQIPPHVSSRWYAAPGDAESVAGFGRERAEALERLVNRRAGARAVWFERLADGSGRRVGAGETLAQAAFPELLLAEAWPQADADLVAAYLEWLAPRLLVLPLAQATRARVERAAASRPDEVARFFRLYPAVADPQLMNSLRVQARLIQAAG